MHIHILGICGTFMGSLAQLAKAAGHHVSGCDANVYPPMSSQLEQAGIQLIEGFDPAQLDPAPDLIIVGNAMSRGNPCVEYMLDNHLPYTSGPQWFGEHLLRDNHVLALSGTHGKTTTTSMLAKILDFAGLEPGFLIGGVPQDFGVSARLGGGKYFVVEADEYDSAFFDKRSKFVHYHADTLVMNNLEFDHADIFENLAAIQKQFHHLLRTIPGNGCVIYPADDGNLQAVVAMGCWSNQQTLNGDQSVWRSQLISEDGSRFQVFHQGNPAGEVSWQHSGMHNVSNALAAIAAAANVGVDVATACAALCNFEGVKRRMEVIYQDGALTIYDDFAHHPTAIKTTLAGLRARAGSAQVTAIIEPRSATMRMGVHSDTLAAATADADQVLWYQNPQVNWNLSAATAYSPVPAQVLHNLDSLLEAAMQAAEKGGHIVIMSNGGFEGFHQKLIERLKN